MVALRVSGIASNFLFIGYGYLVAAYPPLILHVFLLPLKSHAAAGNAAIDQTRRGSRAR